MGYLELALGAGSFLIVFSGAMFGMVKLALNGTKQAVNRIDETVDRIDAHCGEIDRRVSRIEGHLGK